MKQLTTIAVLTAALSCATSQKTLSERLVEENICHGKGRVVKIEDESLEKKTAENRAITDYVINCLGPAEQALVMAKLQGVAVYVEYNHNTREAIAYNPKDR